MPHGVPFLPDRPDGACCATSRQPKSSGRCSPPATIWGFDVRNVVFMGMGEPLDNPDNVIQAIRVLVDQRGLDIARRYITVSTVGLTAGIDRLARFDGGPVNLAVSLNAPHR
jgi:adenine C2-methylase RlmN of 23S rRNA A2503 and tRNA A37